MWSKFKLLWERAGYRWLAVALLLSTLLHLTLIARFYFNLNDLGSEPLVIKAQLVAPPAKSSPPKPVAKPQAKRKALAKPAPSVQPHLASQPEAASLPIDTPAVSNGLEEVAIIQPDVEEEAINANAYHYVEAKYDVRTDVAAKFDSGAAGKAAMEYQLLPDGSHYQLRSVIEASGLASLFIPNLLQTSDGVLVRSGLQPQHYLYQFGSKKNKTFSADFDWPNQKLRLHSASEDRLVDLPEGAQDLLSFMYQFMFVAPLQNMQITVTNGKKLGIYDYSFEGEEIVPTKMGNLNTFHILRRSAEGDDKTELWLALDYQHVPVKIRKTEKEGKVYELLITSLKTETPATPTP